ncbi:SHOCT domain-containing protein [Dielma fastidiosa]|uniref:SHOCT domain-containing protein n=1 Tax=Dielma fastidiosa TaxID=1034346 RepID=UPI00356AB35E
MKNKQLNEFDHLHVSKQAKTELLTQIQNRQAKNSRRFPLLSKVLVSLALIGIFMIYTASQTGSQFLDYERYLTISASEVEYPLQKNQQAMEELDVQFDLGLISESEYQQKMAALRKDQAELLKKQVELKQEYKLDQPLDLNQIKFSQDNARDQQLKDFYLQKTTLDNKTADLLNKNDELMALYESGQIDWQTYIDRKQPLEQQQHDLSAEKDQWENSYAQTDSNYQKLYEQKKLLEQQAEALEIEEDQLKEQYKQGLISKTEYQQQKEALEQKEDALDHQEDQLDDLEDAIEDQEDEDDDEYDMDDEENELDEKDEEYENRGNSDKEKEKDNKETETEDDDIEDQNDDD